MPVFSQDGPKAQEHRRAGVNAERARRIVAGTEIAIDGYGPIPVQGRPEDMTNLTGLYNIATEKRRTMDTTASMVFRDRDNVVHSLTPQNMIDLYVAAIAWVEAIYQASWALKEGAVPRDYADDRHWP